MKGLTNIIIAFFFLTTFSFSQIVVNNGAPYNTSEYLVTEVLLGSGMTASNFTWQSGPTNIGYFDGTNANIGFEEGVILCTGGADFVSGGFGGGAPNITGDGSAKKFYSLNTKNLAEFG